MKKVLINVEDRAYRIAILEDDQLVELYFESQDDKTILNNVYKGRIEGVIPGLKAAFVNIGLEKNAFLHFDDVRPDLLIEKPAAPAAEVEAEKPEQMAAEPVPPPEEPEYQPSAEELAAVEELSVAPVEPPALAEAQPESPDEFGGRRRRRRRGRRGGRFREGVGGVDQGAPGPPPPQAFQPPPQQPGPVQPQQGFSQQGPGGGRKRRRDRDRDRKRDRDRQFPQQQRPPQQQPPDAQPPASWMPPPGAAFGTRAATNPYDVFSPYSQPKAPRRDRKKRRPPVLPHEQTSFGRGRPTHPHPHSREDEEGPDPFNRLQPGEIRPGQGAQQFEEEEDYEGPAPGNERFPEQRQGGGQPQAAGRKRKRRTIRRRGPAFYAVRRKAEKAEVEEEPKPKAKRTRKAAAAEPAPEEQKPAKATRPRKAKAEAQPETQAPAAEPAKKKTRARSTKAEQAKEAAPVPVAETRESAEKPKRTRRKPAPEVTPEPAAVVEPAATEKPQRAPRARKKEIAPVEAPATPEAQAQPAAAPEAPAEAPRPRRDRRPARRRREAKAPSTEAKAEGQQVEATSVEAPPAQAPGAPAEAPPATARHERPHRAHERPHRPRMRPVTEALKKGDEVLVQVIKEQIGLKGARISTYVSLPGRYLVLLPYPNEEGGISRRVENIQERKRLKRLLHDISGDQMGFIVRTAGIDRDEQDIRGDVEFLTHEWKQVEERAVEARAPELVYDDHDILYRLARDTFDESISEILIDSSMEADKLKKILQKLIPQLVDRVQVYSEPENIFHKFQVEKQIQKAARRKVWLKSGGYLIIDEAEALTAIDVNTGKFLGKDDQEKMILKNNLEAGKAIARELRLRDIGGLIVIDFIDMRDHRNRETLLHEFRNHLRKDRSKTSVSGISEFGLVEMTRKRVRQSLKKTLFTDCPYCQGAGVVLNERQIWLHIKHEMMTMLHGEHPPREISIVTNPKIRAYIDQNYRETLTRLEQKHGVEISLSMSDAFHVENYAVDGVGRNGQRMTADGAETAAPEEQPAAAQ
jgi:Rne/Rng family ribonuclease